MGNIKVKGKMQRVAFMNSNRVIGNLSAISTTLTATEQRVPCDVVNKCKRKACFSCRITFFVVPLPKNTTIIM